MLQFFLAFSSHYIVCSILPLWAEKDQQKIKAHFFPLGTVLVMGLESTLLRGMRDTKRVPRYCPCLLTGEYLKWNKLQTPPFSSQRHWRSFPTRILMWILSLMGHNIFQASACLSNLVNALKRAKMSLADTGRQITYIAWLYSLISWGKEI